MLASFGSCLYVAIVQNNNMTTFDEDDDYLEAEDEHLNDIVSFPPAVQETIDQVEDNNNNKKISGRYEWFWSGLHVISALERMQ